MSSLLARQLEAHRVNNPLPPPADAKKSRPSILYKDKANNLDAKQVLDVGRNGLQRLCALDGKFKKYQATIFSTALGSDSRSERQLLPKSERETVDEQCRELLLDLSPHLYSEAGKQALEFLIQRYFVHIYNADALFCAVLPYHETELFTDIASLPSLAVLNTKWEFISKIKLDARGLTRAYLVQVACKDISVFEEICKATCVHNPRFFSAFALECFERLSQNSSTVAQLESTVSVVTRSALEALKVDRADNIMAACAVIGTMSRLTFLATEPCEAFLIVLVRRLDSVGKKSAPDLLNECRLDVSRCVLQMFEWQSRPDSSMNEKKLIGLFREQERWAKFEKYVRRNIQSLIDVEDGRTSKLLDELCVRYVEDLNVDGMKIVSQSFSWNGEGYFERAVRVFQTSFSALINVDEDETATMVLREVIQTIARDQPKAFQASFSAFTQDKRAELVTKCFPDGNSSLAIQLVPFENDMNLPLAIRDSRIALRLSALKHLKDHPNKIARVVFEDDVGDGEGIGFMLLQNYLAEEIEGHSKDADEEFKLIFELFLLVRDSLSLPRIDAIHAIARQGLRVLKKRRDTCLLLVAVLTGGAALRRQPEPKKGKKKDEVPVTIRSEDDLFVLAQVALDAAHDEHVRNAAMAGLDGSWLAGLSLSISSAKAIVKHLKTNQVEELERKLSRLAEFVPEATSLILDELIRSKTFASEAADWLLSLIEKEKIQSPSTAPKEAAHALLGKSPFQDLCRRIINFSVAAWPTAVPVLAEVIASTPSDDVKAFLSSACKVSLTRDGEKDERRIVRALRLLRAQYVAANPTVSHNGGKKQAADKAAMAWVPLLGALRHPRLKQIRMEALNVLALIPGRLAEVLLERKGELERDATAVDRAIARDDQVRIALVKQALALCKDRDFAGCRTVVNCLNDASLASNVLSFLFSSSKPQNNDDEDELEALVEAAFERLEATLENNGEKKILAELCEKGLVRCPKPTLVWMIGNYSSVGVSSGLFDGLLSIAQGEEGINEQKMTRTSVDDVERGGYLLTHILFPESLVLTRLKQTKDSLGGFQPPQSARKRRSASIDAAGLVATNAGPLDGVVVRKLSVLVDVAAAHPPRSWELVNELLGLLKLARDHQAGLLEQAIMSCLERNADGLVSAENKSREIFCDNMIQEANMATSATARYAAIRTFCKSHPSFDAFTKAFTMITDARALEELAEAVTSVSASASATNVPSRSRLIETFCDAIHRLQPTNRLQLLRSFAARCESPAELVAEWIRTSGSEIDCSAIVSQFKSSVQTDILIQLVKNDSISKENHDASIAFVRKHLESQAFLLALVERDDSDISQFIELFESLLMRVLESEEQAETKGEEAMRRLKTLEAALDNLSVLLSVPVFFPVVGEILQNSDAKVRLLALRVLKTKIDEEHADWKKEESRYVLEFAQALISELADGDRKHTSVLAVNALAAVLAASHREVFTKTLPQLAKILNEDGGEVITQSAACLCIGTILKNVSTLSLPHLPEIIPCLIARASVLKTEGEILRLAAIASLKDLIESKVPLGQFLEQIVDEVALRSEDDDLVECIGQNLEIRLGFPLCLHALRSDISFTKSMTMLGSFVARTTSSEAIVQFAELKKICAECLKHTRSVDQFDSAVLVKIGLLLSEKKLRELIESLVLFVEESEEHHGDDELGPNPAGDALVETIRALTEKCGTLFLPVFPFEFVMSNFVSIVRGMKATPAGIETGKKKENKRQKLSGSPLQISLETSLRCVSECLAHAISTGYVDSDKFERLLPPLVSSLQFLPVGITSQFVEPALASLAHCVLTSSHANAMLQTLHHAVTKLLKNDSVQVRRAALSCVKTLFERVGNDYLMLMPDTLPYLAELLEDKDEAVRILAQKVALVLRDLSGEDISEFLK